VRVREELPGHRVEWYETSGSTMTLAAGLARQGCASGTIVGAEEQTAGIGRQGRSWLSARRKGLYVSVVLRLGLDAEALPVVMLALGVAAREAIVNTTGLTPDLRWPNDVLIIDKNGVGKKCAGMLAQLDGGAIIAGIGINISQPVFPPDFETPAISLAMAGAEVEREDLLIALVHALDRYFEALSVGGPPAILRAFTEVSSYAVGRRVRAERDGRRIEGVTCGLDPSGFLKIREDSGMETVILAGGVRPVGE
jgi:BirA family biotin operon repressor/biotin-[acetyl-CoA-carboxylase] ligase